MGRKNIFIGHKVIYYSKFYYELNHIEYFWYDKKSWIYQNCEYILGELRKDIPKTLK